MFKGEKPQGGLVNEVMKNKTEEEQKAAQAKIDGLAFQKALVEGVIDNLSEEEINQMEIDAANLGPEKFAAQIREKYQNFNNLMEEKKKEAISGLETSLEEVDGIDVDMAGKVGEIAFRGAMNEIIAEADDEVIDALNEIMASNASLEEKMAKVEEMIPNFQEVLAKHGDQTADDIKRLADMTKEKLAKLKKEREIE